MKPSIRIQIDYIHDGTRRDVLFLDTKEIPVGMAIERVIRHMLQSAADRFLDKPKAPVSRD